MRHARWEERPTDPGAVAALAAGGLPEAVARVLVGRGLTSAAALHALTDDSLQQLPDPFSLKDVDVACRVVEETMRAQGRIVAWGDYDMDGTSSLALLSDFFRQIGYPIEAVVPRREEEGYGLRTQHVDELIARGTALIITLDNGISAVEEIRHARERGLRVIVVDHHQLGPELPPADAVINPLRPDCSFPYKQLAAVGLTFMLTAGLRRHLVGAGLLAREHAPNLRQALDWVAMGTVADLVPLVGLNRLFVRFGLPLLTRPLRPGIMALKEAVHLALDAPVGSYTVGFVLAPPINAAGRIGDPRHALELLVSRDLERARELARLLDDYNARRKGIVLRVFDEALAALQAQGGAESLSALVVDGEDWPEGVAGLVAARLVERFGKPAIVISRRTDGEAKGSCRSIPALHMQQALAALAPRLLRFGGHSQAAGFSIAPGEIAAFRREFLDIVAARLRPEDYIPRIKTDGPLALDVIDHDLLSRLEALAPFGVGFEAPCFIARGVEVLRASVRREKHLKLDVRQGNACLAAIGFNMADRPVGAGDRIDVVFIPEYNVYRGVRSIQLRLLDLALHEDEP